MLNKEVFSTTMISWSVYFGAIAFVCISPNNGYDIPSYITPCYSLDAECLTNKGNEYLKDFSKGILELGVRPLDPYYVEKMSLNLGGLGVGFDKGIVTGLSKCRINKLAIEVKTRKININAMCNVTVRGKYKTKGKLLALNLDGDGDVKIKIKKLLIKVDIGFGFEKRAGEYYMKLHKEYKHSSKVLGYAHFDLTNLFGGNKQLSTPVLTFINQNWEQLYNEFSGPVLDKAVDLAVENINNFFNKIPRSVLTPGFDALYNEQELGGEIANLSRNLYSKT